MKHLFQGIPLRKRSCGTLHGLTLMEVEISLLILAICILALVSLYSTGALANKKARALTTATFLAQEKLEEVLASFQGLPMEQEEEAWAGPCALPFEAYTFRAQIPRVSDTSLVTVRVTIRGPAGVEVSLTSLK